MKERGIIFSAPMVRAILDGTKTQTRRIVKPQPVGFWDEPNSHAALGLNAVVRDAWGKCRDLWISPPYGSAGDRLWVREAWRPTCEEGSWNVRIEYAADGASRYLFDGCFEPGDWRMPKAAARGNVTSLFMPRWASRLTLEIADVRVERLKDISEDDARAEGCSGRDPEPANEGGTIYAWKGRSSAPNSRAHFAHLWDSINAKGAPWDSNPFVWAISFKRIEQSAVRSA